LRLLLLRLLLRLRLRRWLRLRRRLLRQAEPGPCASQGHVLLR